MPDRSKDRRRALDLLFEVDQRRRAGEPVSLSDTLTDRLADPAGLKPQRSYAAQIVLGVDEHAERIDELLATYSAWTLDRMPAVDRSILRMGVRELLYNDDIPDGVAVEQATNLASELSTDESPGYINGLLGQLQRLAPTLRTAQASGATEQ